MPNRYYEHGCDCSSETASSHHSRCRGCGAPGRFVGWQRTAHNHWGHVARDLGVHPLRSKPGFDEILGLRVRCRACSGPGYRPDESRAEFCLVCEGSGGFWHASEEQLGEAYARLDQEAPDARAPNCPLGFPLVELAAAFGSHGEGGGQAPSFEARLFGELVGAVRSAHPPEPDSPPGAEEQRLLDACVEGVHGGLTIPEDVLPALKEMVAHRLSDSEIYGGRWAGLGELVLLDGSIHLPDLLWYVEDELGGNLEDHPPEDLIDAFRRAWECAMMCGPGYYCRAIRSSEGETAWLGFRHNDAAEVDVVGLYPTPLRFEEELRSDGWLFSLDPEGRPPGSTDHFGRDGLPSGKRDGFTDEDVLRILTDARRR